jgi:hypothetical protein
MKLAIMQPYFFPYIGYFSLIQYADLFILFDTPQYDRKGWMKRNRILKPKEKGGWQYINAGVIKPSFRASIKDVKIDSDMEWKNKISRQIEHYKIRAPFYSEIKSFLERVLQPEFNSLTELNKHTLQCVCKYIGISHDIKVFSDLNLTLGSVKHPGQWALRISEAMKAKEYINPPAGREMFNMREFDAVGVTLSFLAHSLHEYSQRQDGFEAGLSILDVLMFNDIDRTRELIGQYTIGTPTD